MVCSLCEHVRLTAARGDQLAQIAGHEAAPPARAGIEAFPLWDETDVGKADLGLAVFLEDLEDDLRSIPLALVLDEAKPAVGYAPDELLAGNEFRYLLRRAVDVLVTVGELGAELVGVALVLPRPPCADVRDGGECCFRSLFDRN